MGCVTNRAHYGKERNIRPFSQLSRSSLSCSTGHCTLAALCVCTSGSPRVIRTGAAFGKDSGCDWTHLALQHVTSCRPARVTSIPIISLKQHSGPQFWTVEWPMVLPALQDPLKGYVERYKNIYLGQYNKKRAHRDPLLVCRNRSSGKQVSVSTAAGPHSTTVKSLILCFRKSND